MHTPPSNLGRVILALSLGLLTAPPLTGAATFGLDAGYPGSPPGRAEIVVADALIAASNQVLGVKWETAPGGLRMSEFRGPGTGGRLTFQGELFQIRLAGGQVYPASKLIAEIPPRRRELVPDPKGARVASRVAGWQVELPLRAADGTLQVVWRATLTDDANYLRQEVDITPLSGDCVIQEIAWLEERIPGARTAGRVDGSPMVAGGFFFGAEDPHALNSVGGKTPSAAGTATNAAAANPALAGLDAGTEGRVTCRLKRDTPLQKGGTLNSSFVMGVAPEGQMRRAFLYYVERERAHPYRPFLHYNSWYDIAWEPFNLNETNCLEAIRLFGERFIQPHGVIMDAMVFDDGWDDPRSLWGFHRGFPNGFQPLAALCRQYGTRLGVWLSPFGGYGAPKEQRLKYGREQGFETNANGFSLAGPKYYGAFKNACVRMIRDYGVNHFKFDGIASGMYADGAGADYLLDTEAMRRLMLELRREDPDLYINLTTGSWPSPFWLRYADSLWRQGGDMGFAGKGPKQQQWLTYRDQETYRNIVGKGPLYPLNSLMTQGVAYSRRGDAGLPEFNSAGFKDDVRMFFGSGTGLQELYVQPGKLTADDWAVLAEAARWSRTHAAVLVDTHWIGGDPSKGEVYGYASWSPAKGIVTLRNPDDRPHVYALDLGTAFELPPGVPQNYTLESPWMDVGARPVLFARAGRPLPVTLEPFQILIMEALPMQNLPASISLIPQPASLETKPGSFELTAATVLVAGSGTEAEVGRLADLLRAPTGFELPVVTQTGAGPAIVFTLKPALETSLGREGYRLVVASNSVEIEAATDAGLFYAGTTLRQLLPPEICGATRRPAPPFEGWTVPCVVIQDSPRFVWRGLLLDVARHYLPLEDIKKFVDTMALHKFNQLQLHLTDDQGWRIEIKKYPRLTQVGSVRKESPARGQRDQGDGTPYGPFFYTQEQMRDLVAYAQARHITILPEIEMPGHFLAALTAYPEYSCQGGPFAVRTRWGVEPDILCAGQDRSCQFAQDILEEIVAIFPGPYIHIGGDEAPRDRWHACPRCQARMKAEGFTREAQLQTWLNRRLEGFLATKNRRLIGWDEILEGGLTPGATVMSWRGTEGGLAAAKAGHDVVMSPTSHCYLDYAQAKGPGEPESIGGYLPLETVYAFEPVPADLPEPQRQHILGGQGNVWTEYIRTLKEVEYFAWPRAAALAEVLWTPAGKKDFQDFQKRLRPEERRFELMGVNHRPLD